VIGRLGEDAIEHDDVKVKVQALPEKVKAESTLTGSRDLGLGLSRTPCSAPVNRRNCER
jgi:hypothetical protein